MCDSDIFFLQENKWNNVSFHKTALARTLRGIAATQLKWGGRFHTRYGWWLFLIVKVNKLLQSVNRNQIYCSWFKVYISTFKL